MNNYESFKKRLGFLDNILSNLSLMVYPKESTFFRQGKYENMNITFIKDYSQNYINSIQLRIIGDDGKCLLDYSINRVNSDTATDYLKEFYIVIFGDDELLSLYYAPSFLKRLNLHIKN